MSFDEKLKRFSDSIKELSTNNSVPKWFKPFVEQFKTFATDVSKHFEEIEGKLAVTKAVTDNLEKEKDRLHDVIHKLDIKIDDQEQYSRRNCLMIHGIAENANEKTDDIVMDLLDNKLKAEIQKKDVSRTHRVGRKRNDRGGNVNPKPRPIIVRFSSYRERKKAFDKKKNLKGQGILVTENLTKRRHSLLSKCFDVFEKNNVWTLDGRVYCKSKDGDITVYTNIDDLNDDLADES